MLCPPHRTTTVRVGKMRAFHEGGKAVERTTCSDCGQVWEVPVTVDPNIRPFDADDWAWFGKLFASGKVIRIADRYQEGGHVDLTQPPSRATGHWHRIPWRKDGGLTVCEEPHGIAAAPTTEGVADVRARFPEVPEVPDMATPTRTLH